MPNNPGNTRDDGSRSEQGAGSQKDKKNPSASQGQSSSQGGQKSSMSSGQNSGRGQESQSQGKKSSQGSQGSQQRGVSGGASSQNLRLQLTPEQQAQIRKATGRDASSLELSVEDIEDSLGESEGQSSSRGSSESKDDSDYDDEPTSGNRGNSSSEF